jgi:hypothetical protein
MVKFSDRSLSLSLSLSLTPFSQPISALIAFACRVTLEPIAKS